MYTNEEYCEIVLLYWQCNRSKIEAARLYAIKFPIEDIHLIVQYQRLYKAGSCHRRILLSRVTPSSLRIPAEDVLGYALAHLESSVRDISKACSYSKLTVWNILHTRFLEDEVSWDLSRIWYQHNGAPTHKSAQPCTFLAQILDTRIIGYGGQQEWSP
ncbi:DUF4817 domain-containing protein [Trichonephila clavipes]|uniref:DUF4817 domain-containing protein n=1 Tax=Trichonephila clavipes TaxID=2585209 RepID=A0A8X6UTW3_TRICX|nr:DUF4817 domain-containing protein [Trichonephila clavipes]